MRAREQHYTLLSLNTDSLNTRIGMSSELAAGRMADF